MALGQNRSPSLLWLKCEVDGILAAAPWALMIQLSVPFSQIYPNLWYQLSSCKYGLSISNPCYWTVVSRALELG
jgi:hypothetical protein